MDSQTACNSYTWIDGVTYTTSNNTATHTLTGSNGCDSLVTLDLTILNSTFGMDSQTACNSYTWIDGVTYTTSNNTATHTLTGSNGCDSLVTLDLTILNSTFGMDSQTACNSYTWIDGVTYTTSNNTATHTLTGSNGCDSLVTLDLTINQVSDITTTTSGITITANNSNALFQWLDCTNGFSIIDGETNNSFTPVANGEYAVELTENGCKDTSACISITSVSVIESDIGNQFIIFPNPADEQVFIQTPYQIHGNIEIFDASGKLLIKEEIQGLLTPVKTGQISQGVFFVRISYDRGLVTKKLIKS